MCWLRRCRRFRRWRGLSSRNVCRTIGARHTDHPYRSDRSAVFVRRRRELTTGIDTHVCTADTWGPERNAAIGAIRKRDEFTASVIGVPGKHGRAVDRFGLGDRARWANALGCRVFGIAHHKQGESFGVVGHGSTKLHRAVAADHPAIKIDGDPDFVANLVVRAQGFDEFGGAQPKHGIANTFGCNRVTIDRLSMRGTGQQQHKKRR